jgi:WD40 repeat protein
MFTTQSADISLGDAPCRALCAVRASHEESRFIAGSSEALHVLRFHTEVNELRSEQTFEHGPVNRICSSPTDESLVLTTTEQGQAATLYKMDTSASASNLEQVSTFDHGEPICDIVWRSSCDEYSSTSTASNNNNILTLDHKGGIARWDAETNTCTQRAKGELANKKPRFVPRVAWDPHAVDALAVSSGTGIKILDWRTDTTVPTGTVASFPAHRYNITDVDYNPNKPYVLATSGQDGLLKFWDIRLAKHPVLVARGGHNHWATNVKYNPFHDQLVLSSGTDSSVNLWRVSTISSAPLLDDTCAPNVRVDRHEHGDSVYAIAWGAADAWIYMSLSYDGKAVLNHVPSKEKYKILL